LRSGLSLTFVVTVRHWPWAGPSFAAAGNLDTTAGLDLVTSRDGDSVTVLRQLWASGSDVPLVAGMRRAVASARSMPARRGPGGGQHGRRHRLNLQEHGTASFTLLHTQNVGDQPVWPCVEPGRRHRP
jgi:hypothetical protein